MTAVVGWTSLVLALFSSLALAVQGVRALRLPQGAVERDRLVWPVRGVVIGAVVAMAALEVALLRDDFSVSYVAETSARSTPLLFKITTAWSALEGSLLLWALVLAGFLATTMRGVRSVDDRLGVGALVVMAGVSAFFFALLASVGNPFDILTNPPPDGPGPNPILQNHLMVVIHPPMLYLGLVGFTVPFAFAMSALALRDPTVDWLRRSRRANLVAWSFLTGGLVFGAWWSYEVLGWGGYWAWDPVENAALMPWLTATAFIHSATLQRRRGMLSAWNLVLIISTFALTVLATFLTRSSVISSVHSFSQSPVGIAMLGLLLVVLGGAFSLFALRGEVFSSGRKPEFLFSREGAFLVNNLLLTLFAFVVTLGTLYPVLIEAVSGRQVSVGRPFFDRMAVPLGLALLLAMSVGPFMPYRKTRWRVLRPRLATPLLVASLAAAVLVIFGVAVPGLVVVVFLATGIVVGALRELRATAPSLRPRAVVGMLRRNRGFWGGQVSHIGLALATVAIAASGTLAERSSLELTRDRPAAFVGYSVTYEGSHRHTDPGRSAQGARIVFREGGRTVWVAEPRLTMFANQPQAVGTPDTWTTATRDIYVSLSGLGRDRVSLNVYRYPFMWLLWFGGGLVMAGGLLALDLRRHSRRPTQEAARQGRLPGRVGTDA